jgi:Fe-S-cluster-containing dehydrogenase component
MVVNVDRCIGCDVCLIVCKDQHVENEYAPYTKPQPETGHFWMQVNDVERADYPAVKLDWLPTPCMHCEDAPCVKASGGAVYKRSDGIVIIDPVKAVGKQDIVASCPYGRIYWNADLSLPQKCTFCAHLVDQGKSPRCVEACPLSVITFGDLDDPSSEISTKIKALNAEPLHPEFGTKPKVYYAGLPKPFLSGKVVDGRTGEYLTGATVVLTGTDGQSHTAITDNYADFEFPGLKVRQMYNLRIKKDGYFDKVMLVFLDRAKDIGKLQLFPEGV